MYGQCMLEKFCFGRKKIIFTNLNDVNAPGFYHITFKSENNYIPVLPHHNKFNNKLMFTNGILEGIYWFEEIKHFLKNNGKIIKINYAVIYENFNDCFVEFVEYFNKLRELKGGYKEFAKLIINSLYGRLGMSESTEYSLLVDENEIDWWFNNFEIQSCIEVAHHILYFRY